MGRGGASICIYVYLRYLEFVFVFGCMLERRKKEKKEWETDVSQPPNFGQFWLPLEFSIRLLKVLKNVLACSVRNTLMDFYFGGGDKTSVAG